MSTPQPQRDLIQILEGWGMSKTVCQAFKTQEVTLANVKKLSKADIAILIPHMGPRSTFESCLAKLDVDDVQQPHVTDSALVQAGPSSVAGSNAPGPSSPKRRRVEHLQETETFPFVQNELYHKLKATNPEGNVILSSYSKDGQLSSHLRDMLVERIIYNELGNDFNKRITKARFSELGDLIKELFPTEDKLSYFDEIVKDKKTYVEGSLRVKFYGVRRTFRKAGLIKKQTLVEETIILEDLGSAEDDDDDEDDNYIWLLNNYSPFNLVQIKWDETYLRRMRNRNKLKKAFEYMKRFPALATANGWELLVKDAFKAQPALENALDWDRFYTNILRILSKTKVLKFTEETSEEEKRVTALINLPFIFKVRNVPKSKTAPKGTHSWRPSREEMKEGFILHVENISAIKTKLLERSKRVLSFGYAMQPVPVIVGALKDIQQCFVCLDKYRWEVESVSQALEVALKIDFALDLAYPPEARCCWLYVQRLLFKLELPNEDYKEDKGLRSYMASALNDFV